MPLDKEDVLIDWTISEIGKKWERRNHGKKRTFNSADRTRITAVVQSILKEFGYNNVLKVLTCFIDMNWDLSRRFAPVKNIRWLWEEFRENEWLLFEGAILEGDYKLAALFVDEWGIRQAQSTKIRHKTLYHNSREFYKILEMTIGLRERVRDIPWVFRTHLIAQEQYMSQITDILIPGNVTSDRAFTETRQYIQSKYRYKRGGNAPKNLLDWERRTYQQTGKSLWDLRKHNEPLLCGVNVPFDYPWTGKGESHEEVKSVVQVRGLDRVKK